MLFKLMKLCVMVESRPIHPTTAYPDPAFVLRVGPHSLDNKFAELSVTWRGGGGGGNAINVSIAATADAADSSQLTIMATVNNEHAVNATDFALLVCPLFMFGRVGAIDVQVGGWVGERERERKERERDRVCVCVGGWGCTRVHCP